MIKKPLILIIAVFAVLSILFVNLTAEENPAARRIIQTHVFPENSDFEVIEDDKGSVTGISITPIDQTITVDQTLAVNVTVSPADAINKGVIWSSDDENIASVDQYGSLTGINVGKTIIRAETEDRGYEAISYVRVLFKDVAHNEKYYFEPVYWAFENAITGGVGDGNFAPSENCTREQIVTFLWRLNGEPEPQSESNFTDVKKEKWYYKPISWAYENGITTGLNDGTGRFGVGQPCTRAQCVTFLYRAAGEPENESYETFTDVTAGKYYYDAISWAAANGVTVGLNDGTGRFGVNNKCSRAMIVTFIQRYVKAIEGPSEAESYYMENAEVIEIINVNDSEEVLPETEAISLLEERGFFDCPVTYDYTIGGTYEPGEGKDNSAVKHPMYNTYYINKNNEAWTIYVINGSVFAYPASFNLESTLGVELIVSESETLISYDGDKNQFIVTKPNETGAIVRVVDKINAETLDMLTIEELGK